MTRSAYSVGSATAAALHAHAVARAAAARADAAAAQMGVEAERWELGYRRVSVHDVTVAVAVAEAARRGDDGSSRGADAGGADSPAAHHALRKSPPFCPSQNQ